MGVYAKGFRVYTDKERDALVALWDELVSWPEVRRHARFGSTTLSALMCHRFAEERELTLAATGKVWSYETALRALQEAGRAAPRKERPKRKGRGAVPPKAEAVAAPAKAPEPTPAEAPAKKLTKTEAWLATATPPPPAPEVPTPDAIFAFFEKDLGAFLRPEDMERARGTRDAVVTKKIQELTAELASKTETRARLNVYVGVYDRLIARIIHRLDLLREKGVGPESEARELMREEEEESEEAVRVHEELSQVVPILPIRRFKRST